MRRAGIIGGAVERSASPAIHNAAIAALGLDACYERWPTQPEGLAARVDSLRAAAVLGANVTIPHKIAVMPLLDELDEGANAVGAVNTVINDRGRLTGSNTDGAGFLRSLAGVGFEPRGARVLVIGAGGAARAIVFALGAAGASVTICNRTPSRAEGLAADAAAHGYAVAQTAAPDISAYHCLVNTTSVGDINGPAPTGLPCDLHEATPGTLVADIVYKPRVTPWLEAAGAAGLPVVGGLPMLVYQGAASFERWFGQAPPIDVMMQAADGAV